MSLCEGASAVAHEFDLQLPSGRIHAQRFGPPDAPLVLAVPGLSANMKSFDFLGERLASEELQIVALDLRGRGRSEVTPPGSYGWVNHARDVLDLATALGAEHFTIVGHSMGGAVGMVCAWLAPHRLTRLVLVDICGVPDASVLAPIGAAVDRLGTVAPSVEDYVAAVRRLGTVEPWSEYWERYFRYELDDVHCGVAARSDRQAVMEDGAFGAGAFAFGDGAGIYSLWRCLTMPTLLLRATRELLPGTGHVVPAGERDRFRRRVPTATVVEVDANHYGIVTAEAAAAAIAAFVRDLEGRPRADAATP